MESRGAVVQQKLFVRCTFQDRILNVKKHLLRQPKFILYIHPQLKRYLNTCHGRSDKSQTDCFITDRDSAYTRLIRTLINVEYQDESYLQNILHQEQLNYASHLRAQILDCANFEPHLQYRCNASIEVGGREVGWRATKLLLIQREERKVNFSHKIGLTRRQNRSGI